MERKCTVSEESSSDANQAAAHPAATPHDRSTPEDTLRRFAECVRDRDVEALVSLYEPEAVFSPSPDVVVKGHDGLPTAYREFFGLNPVLDLVRAQIHGLDDLALVANDWTLVGTAPDGTAITKSGRSSVVLRRGAGGAWFIAIDRP